MTRHGAWIRRTVLANELLASIACGGLVIGSLHQKIALDDHLTSHDFLLALLYRLLPRNLLRAPDLEDAR